MNDISAIKASLETKLKEKSSWLCVASPAASMANAHHAAGRSPRNAWPRSPGPPPASTARDPRATAQPSNSHRSGCLFSAATLNLGQQTVPLHKRRLRTTIAKDDSCHSPPLVAQRNYCNHYLKHARQRCLHPRVRIRSGVPNALLPAGASYLATRTNA